MVKLRIYPNPVFPGAAGGCNFAGNQKRNAMKKATLIPFIALFAVISTAQQPLATDDSYRNQAHLSLLPLFNEEKTIQLGFERKTERTAALEIDFGWRFQSQEATEAPFREETLVSSSIRNCDNGVFFLFLLPIPVIDRCRSWNDVSLKDVTYRVHTNAFLSAQYRMYLIPFSKKSPILNGLYLAPGLRIGYQRYTRYVYSEGTQADIQVLDADFRPDEVNPWGLVLLTGFVGTSKIIDESVYTWRELSRSLENRVYVSPVLQLGAAIPIARRFSADVGGLVRFFEKKERKVELAPVVKVGMWF
jgi:hypothetical protein